MPETTVPVEPLEPSQQIVIHANDPDLRQRVAAVAAMEAEKGTVFGLPADPLPDVIAQRWAWASKWGILTTVTDGQIRDACKAIWTEPAPDPVVAE